MAMIEIATQIKLPDNTSRYGHPPETCLALVLDRILSKSECAALIAREDPYLRSQTISFTCFLKKRPSPVVQICSKSAATSRRRDHHGAHPKT
jgi:hypothetical protein